MLLPLCTRPTQQSLQPRRWRPLGSLLRIGCCPRRPSFSSVPSAALRPPPRPPACPPVHATHNPPTSFYSFAPNHTLSPRAGAGWGGVLRSLSPCLSVSFWGRGVTRGRLEGVDVQLATLLVPTRSPEAILTRLLDFRPSYAEYTQRRLDRSLRNQAESQAESHAVAASPPQNPTKRSKRRKLDDGAGASDDSGSGAAPPCRDGGGGEDAAGWSHQAAGGEAAALAALLSVPKSLEERKKMGGKERRAALDLVLSQTEMGAAPINVTAPATSQPPMMVEGGVSRARTPGSRGRKEEREGERVFHGSLVSPPSHLHVACSTLRALLLHARRAGCFDPLCHRPSTVYAAPVTSKAARPTPLHSDTESGYRPRFGSGHVLHCIPVSVDPVVVTFFFGRKCWGQSLFQSDLQSVVARNVPSPGRSAQVDARSVSGQVQ